MKNALSVPKNTVHRERDGEFSTKPALVRAVVLVEAARFLGGQLVVLYRTKIESLPST
jgi:hypothetical protein